MPQKKTSLSRSEQMSRIRGRDTSPELIVRRGLWAAGLRYRLQTKTPGGRADIVLPSKKIAVFVDGCFWHGCPEHYVRPRSQNSFWDAKLRENVDRDRRQTLALDAAGWRVLRVWEHEVTESPTEVTAKILDCALKQGRRQGRSWRVTKVEFLDASGAQERRLLEDLRNPALTRIESGTRSTKKTGRVRRTRLS